MNIDLISGQIAKIHITLDTTEPYELYGGTTRGAFSFERDGETWHVTAREEAVAGVPLCNYDIYARELATGREWVILSGKIVVKPRTASVPADKLHPVEYFITVPVRNSQVDAAGNVIVQGIPGPKGERGEKGEPGEGGMTSEERALLMGAAQRDADNTFSAGNTFTGAVDMSAASVTPPEGWNVSELTPEAIQAVAPIVWFGSTAPTLTGYGIALGSGSTATDAVCIGGNSSAAKKGVAVGVRANTTGDEAVACGEWAQAGACSVALGSSAVANTRGAVVVGNMTRVSTNGISVGFYAEANKQTAITLGSQFTETTDSGNVTHTCITEGTGSITIGAGANTLNNGTTESSNSVTIGCKAENKGADSVVIGAQARGTAAGSVVMGAGASSLGAEKSVSIGQGATCETYSFSIALGAGAKAKASGNIAIGQGAETKGSYASAFGCSSNSSAKLATAIGYNATTADQGCVVFASWSDIAATKTQLYFAGANTPLANQYYNGEAMMGYTVTEKTGKNVLACGTRRLSELFPDNSLTQPASLDENGEWVMPKVFHPSDLDMPTEEPTEPEEYQPLPVYPIVEPEIEPLTE